MFELDNFNARDFRLDPAYLAMFPGRAPSLANGSDPDDSDTEQETQR